MTDKILYVCSNCQEHSPEQCGRPMEDIRVAPDGRWLCNDCADEEFGFQHGFPKPEPWGPRDEAFRAGRIAAAQILREQLTEATRPDQRMTLAIAITAVERGRNLPATEKMKNLMAAMAESEREENARANAAKLANEGDGK